MPIKGKTTLAAIWNDGGNATASIYQNTGNSFPSWNHWNVKDGGWGDNIKWASGDFNGDGKTDIMAAWNNGGSITLTARLSQGNRFTHEHWYIGADPWTDDFHLLPGDFNGDGKVDIALMRKVNGLEEAHVMPSHGNSLATGYRVTGGRWMDQSLWKTGDFNGDGRTDIVNSYPYNGVTQIDVWKTVPGNTFSRTPWGRSYSAWNEDFQLLTGDATGDGRDDVIGIRRMYYDTGEIGTQVDLFKSSSEADAFLTLENQDRSRGGFIKYGKWIPGDFTGDGKSDVAIAWGEGGHTILTMRYRQNDEYLGSHWSTNGGGWMDSTAYCSGKFS